MISNNKHVITSAMDQPRNLSASKARQLQDPRRGSKKLRPVLVRSRTRTDAPINAAPETPWRSVLGPESRLPNIYWGAMSTASLRRMSYYTALPPEDQVLLAGEATYRYVRQGTALWSALHAARLTTSRLKDALGLRDRTAARLVGGPQFPEMGVLQAYNHLLQPPYTPSSSSDASAGSSSSRQRSETEALQLNEAARLQYNEEMVMAAAGAAARVSEAGLEAKAGRGPRAAAGSGAARRSAASGLQDDGDHYALEEGWSSADRRRISELAALSVGAAGSVRMRLLWGSLQEASAVATLAALFPTSQLEEVGLLCLADPRPWGVEPRELPPIGASPDALVVHHVPITRTDIQVARAELWATAARGGHHRDNTTHDVADGGGGDGAAAAAFLASEPLRGAAIRIARSVLRAALVRHTQIPTAVAAASGGTAPSLSSSPLLNGGSRTDVRSRSPPLFASGSEEAVEWLVGELMRPPNDQGGAAAAAPSASASFPASALLASASALSGLQLGVAAEGHPAGGGSAAAVGMGMGCSQGDDVAAIVRLREIVEVKNHCPFVYKGQRKARKRGVVLDYVVRDRGPIESLWPVWVPQLQAHLACSGADSGLLLSRSPSRGVRVFRMFRDDAYLEAAFDLLRELQYTYVARKQPPGSDPWVGRPGFDDFVQRTLAIARASEIVVATPTTPQLPGTDLSAFWDMK
ncbi:hypothetical protein PLESTM_000280300 [Pleodorina starrii]|nr:hypothetical protein PLESTM_000280300 [Pleodorina starrii]